jgi:hypothetical protein
MSAVDDLLRDHEDALRSLSSSREVAAATGTYPGAVVAARRVLGCVRRIDRIPPDVRADMGRVPDDEIARRLGVTRQTALRMRREMGIRAGLAPPRDLYSRKIVIPGHFVAATSRREHWRKRAARVSRERAAMKALLCEASKLPDDLGPVRVTFTRVAMRPLDEGENLTSAFKAYRDQIASWIGRDDRPGSGVEWKYQQVRGKPSCAIVQIQETARADEVER